MLYVITGTDAFRKSEAIAKIIQEGSYERHTVATLQDGINHALSPGLFSKQALVFEAKELPCKDSSLLEQVVNTENALILNLTSVDGRTKLGKWLKTNGNLEKLDQLTVWQEDRIKSQISWRSKALGLQLSFHTIQYLLEAVGSDLGRLQRELELLKAYFGNDPVETYKVAELVPNLAQTSYHLAKELTNSPENVFERTEELMDRGIHPLQILATVTNRIERLMLVAISCEYHQQTKEKIAEFAQVPNPKQVFYLIQEIEGISARQLQDIFVELENLTHQLKRGLDPETLPLKLALIASKVA